MHILRTVFDLLAGNDVKMRRMLGYWALTMALYGLCMVMLWFEVYRGLASAELALWLSAWLAGGGMLFYCVIRASERWRLAISRLAFAQAVFSVVAIVAAYSFVGSARGATLSLMPLVMIFCGLALSIRQSLMLTGFTIGLLALTMWGMHYFSPLAYPLADEAVNFVIATSMLCATAFLNGQFSKLRARLTVQKRDLGEALQRIQLLATHDEMTGLPNRMHMRETLVREAQRHKREGQTLCLAMLDIDLFKRINDTYGHPVGDDVLCRFAHHAGIGLRMTDMLARWGGEEFCLLMPNTGLQAGMRVVERMRADIAELDLSNIDRGLRVTFSAGVTALSPGELVPDAIQRADKAMYQAKGAGRNTVVFFDADMEAGLTARVTLESEMREALRDNQFQAWYQPQINARGLITGVETLVRWQHPRRGLILPGEFISMAEETGQIVPLGYQVLKTACKQLAAWSTRTETAHLTVSVNVSARQFRHAEFLSRVLAMLDEFKFNPRRLRLELTESMLLDDLEATIVKMGVLKSRGISFSLDDFGTGYSSLSYLKRLPIDELKIDASFVREVLTDNNDAVIARSIVALANSLGLGVIAEGVESEGQRRFLIENGCVNFQGFLFSRALMLEHCEAFIIQNGLQQKSLVGDVTGALTTTR